jgi:hypothetical protein
MVVLISTIVVLKLPLEVSVKKDKAGNCPLYSHEKPRQNGKGTSCLRQLCFNRK